MDDIHVLQNPMERIFLRQGFPEHPTLEQYQRLFYGYEFKDVTAHTPYATYYKNTIIVTVISMTLVLFLIPWLPATAQV
jgi:ABC-type maltose transport system permease subunit